MANSCEAELGVILPTRNVDRGRNGIDTSRGSIGMKKKQKKGKETNA